MRPKQTVGRRAAASVQDEAQASVQVMEPENGHMLSRIYFRGKSAQRGSLGSHKGGKGGLPVRLLLQQGRAAQPRSVRLRLQACSVLTSASSAGKPAASTWATAVFPQSPALLPAATDDVLKEVMHARAPVAAAAAPVRASPLAAASRLSSAPHAAAFHRRRCRCMRLGASGPAASWPLTSMAMAQARSALSRGIARKLHVSVTDASACTDLACYDSTLAGS